MEDLHVRQESEQGRLALEGRPQPGDLLAQGLHAAGQFLALRRGQGKARRRNAPHVVGNIVLRSVAAAWHGTVQYCCTQQWQGCETKTDRSGGHRLSRQKVSANVIDVPLPGNSISSDRARSQPFLQEICDQGSLMRWESSPPA